MDENEAPEVRPDDAGEISSDVPQSVPAATPQPEKVRLRDRMWSFRAMVAVAIATLLLGGAGGAAIVAATGHDHGDRERFGRFVGGPGGGREGFGGNGPGFGQQGQGWGQPGQPGQGEQLPPLPAPGSNG